MDNRSWDIIEILKEDSYIAATEIGKRLGISEKTVRNRIREAMDEMEDWGAEIISRPRYGYCIQITDPKKWQEFCRKRYDKRGKPPETSGERVEYILAMLLGRRDYIKTEALSEFLYVSTKTLTSELKRVEYILEHFALSLDRKPYYGICVTGSEFSKRCCILQNFYLSPNPFWEGAMREEEAEKIASLLLKLTRDFEIKFMETAFRNTVYYIQLGISRMQKGFYIEEISEEIFEENQEEIQQEIRLAKALYQELGELAPKIPRTEIFYTGAYIAGKRIMGVGRDMGGVIVASEKLDSLITHILEEIYLTYHVDLRSDLNLRIMLIQHIMPMEIRLKYGIPVEVYAQEIKEQNILCYTMAQLAATILSKNYKKPLPEDELLCIAIYFALALDEQKVRNKKKNNVLLVCVSGKASSQMLMYRFKREFGEYIEKLTVCGIYDFDHMDLTDIDLIFTTVPLYKRVSVPVMQIRDFLESKDIASVRHFMQMGDMQFLEKYFRKDLFFTDIWGDTREEVIHEICLRMQGISHLPKEFEASVLEREEMGATDYGNLCAIPHPMRLMSRETMVAVAVLPKAICWSKNPVRVVILVSLKDEEGDDNQKFYEVIADFLSDENAVGSLIETPVFENFENLITAMKR